MNLRTSWLPTNLDAGALELEISPEDEEILDRVWEEIRAEKAAARERERLPRVA